MDFSGNAFRARVQLNALARIMRIRIQSVLGAFGLSRGWRCVGLKILLVRREARYELVRCESVHGKE